jgi:SAM-dependent methyltransferase
MTGHEVVVDFPACLAADFPRELPLAERAVDQVLAAIEAAASFKALEDRSPGLRGNDWSNYLRCSEARMVRVAKSLRQQGFSGGRLLDYGAYFGNFAAMFRDLGFEVDAVDAYQAYAPSLDPVVAMLGGRGIRVLDFAAVGRDLQSLPPAHYDVVLCMGVIEHVPHTARVLLEPLDRVLKPGGLLFADTPNVAQLPNRQKLARGESVAPPIDIQYHAEIPFEGHHREYTAEEMVWMAQELGHDMVAVDLYNYSVYGQPVLHGRDATNHWRMIANPLMRELVMIVTRKPASGVAPRRVGWQDVFQDTEQYWRSRLPAGLGAEGESGILAAEALVTDLQTGVNERDRMLQELQAQHQAQHDTFTAELVARQAENAALMDRLGALQFAYDMTPVERLKRAVRRLLGRR